MSTITRAITMPILKPVDGTWDDLGDSIRQAWNDATVCANAVISALYHADFMAKESRDDIPKMAKLNTYRIATGLLPHMPTGTVSAIDRQVRRRYTGKNSRGHRVRWSAMVGMQSLPSFRSPMPYPCRAQDWRPELTEGGDVIVHVTLPPKKRWALVLRNGGGFARQYATAKRIASGELKYRELSIVERRDKASGKSIPMVKIVFDQPVKETPATGTLMVRTTASSLLVALDEKEKRKLWWYHADDLRRRILDWERRRQRLADDYKHEARRRRGEIKSVRDAATDKHRRFVKTYLDQISARLAGYAGRHNIGTVVLDDSDRGFCAAFPWEQMKLKVKEKLENIGIAFESVKAGEAQS